MTVEELRIILSVQGQSQVVNQVTRVNTAVIKLDNGIGKLASTLAKFISAGAIFKFSEQCVKAAANLQRVSNVLNTTFGSTAEQLNNWVKNNAAALGLTETAAKKSLGIYGNLAEQFGYTTQQAATMSVELTKLSSNVAAFYGITTDAAAQKLQGVFTGRTMGMKELGIVMNDATLNAYLLQKGINKTMKELSAQDKVTVRYMYTMEKLNHTQGFYQKTTGGWAHSIRDLKLNLEQLKIEVGNQLLPVAVYTVNTIARGIKLITPAIVTVAKTVRLYTEAWKNASSVVKGYAKVAAAAIGIALITPKIATIVSKAIKLLTIDVLTLKGAISAIAGIVGVIFSIMAIKELSKEVENIKADEAAKKMEDLAGGILGTADAVDDLSDSLGDLGDSTKDMDLFLASFDEVNKIGGGSSLMSGLVTDDDIANILNAASGIDDLSAAIADMDVAEVEVPEGTIFSAQWWDEKIQFVKGFFGEVKERIIKIFNFFEKVGAAIYDFVHKYISPFIDKLKSAFSTFGEKIAPLIEDAKLFAEAWCYAWGQIGAAIEEAVEKLKEFIKKREEAGADYWDRSHDENGNATTTGAKILDKIIGVEKYASGGTPRKGSLFIAGESGPELVGSFGDNMTRVVNAAQMQAAARRSQYTLPSTSELVGSFGDNFGSFGSGGSNRTVNISSSQPAPQPIVLTPTFDISIDGRKIAASVFDYSSKMTVSSGSSPVIQIGR